MDIFEKTDPAAVDSRVCRPLRTAKGRGYNASAAAHPARADGFATSRPVSLKALAGSDKKVSIFIE